MNIEINTNKEECVFVCVCMYAGLHKTGIRGIQDTRQIVVGKTKNKENNDKKCCSRFLNIRQLMKKAI